MTLCSTVALETNSCSWSGVVTRHLHHIATITWPSTPPAHDWVLFVPKSHVIPSQSQRTGCTLI